MRGRWLLLCWLVLACSSGGKAGVASTSGALADVAADIAAPDVLADLGPPDAGPDVPDIASADIASPDIAKDSGPADVGLPIPATVPSDLPPGVVAFPLWSGKLDNQGRSPDTKLKLPANTVSLLAVVLGEHPGFFGLATLIGPDGTPYGKGQCNDLCIACKNRVGASPGTGTALLPSTSGVQASAGNWHVTSCGFAWKFANSIFAPQPDVGAAVDTVLFAKTTADGVVPGQAILPLRLFLSGAAGLSAANAKTDPRIVGMLKEANQVYASVGVTVTVVDVVDIEPGHTIINLPEDVTISGQSDLDSLFAQAGKVGGSAVIDVFLVDQLLGGGIEGKGIVGGVAGAIPGPAFYHGIPRAGVAIAIGALGGDALLAGRTLAHELGHFMGLWHPSERDGKSFDPLDDTKECPVTLDVNADGVVDPMECAGQGADDAMFWFAVTAPVGFTLQQGVIVRGNPLALPAAVSGTSP